MTLEKSTIEENPESDIILRIFYRAIKNWWFFLIVGFPSSEGYVARVLQNKVKKWLASSHSQFKALPQLDEYYFRYLVTFRDKMEMDVLLPKGSETICFGEDLELDTWSLETLKMCTQREKAQFFSAVRQKLAESNISTARLLTERPGSCR